MESFDKKFVMSTRLSLSTKIPEYLNANKPILAYGPDGISSLEYLKDNKLANVCTNKEELKNNIEDLIKQIGIYSKEKHTFVSEHHDIEKNRVALRSYIKGVID